MGIGRSLRSSDNDLGSWPSSYNDRDSPLTDHGFNDGFTVNAKLVNNQEGRIMFVPNEPTLQWLETLANKYNELAGQAFATMRDDDAKKFRDAAKALRELKATLPALPKPAGPTVR